MAYDKHQATAEFNHWSESYDRCILQWLLFGPSHRALIRRIRAVAGDRAIRILDVGCGTGVFASRLRAAFPEAQVCGIDLVAGMLDKGRALGGRMPVTCSPSRGTANACRSRPGRSTWSPAPTASITIPTRTAPSPRCTGCCGRGGGCS